MAYYRKCLIVLENTQVFVNKCVSKCTCLFLSVCVCVYIPGCVLPCSCLSGSRH